MANQESFTSKTRRTFPTPRVRGIRGTPKIKQSFPGVPKSKGALYFNLVIRRNSWIHRRVETISFLPDDVTQRRVTYDFTLPSWTFPLVIGNSVGVPLTQMKKEMLKNLSVMDASGKALSVYGSEQNGELGVEILESLIGGYLGSPLNPKELTNIRDIVFCEYGKNVSTQLDFIAGLLNVNDANPTPLSLIAMDFVRGLSKNFIFLVDVPKEIIGTRNIVKVSYDRELKMDGDIQNMFSFGRDFIIEPPDFPNSRSSHLEVRAPEGLQVIKLVQIDDKRKSLVNVDSTTQSPHGHVAHIKMSSRRFVGTVVNLEMRPTFSGLIFQTWLGSTLALVFFSSELLGIGRLYKLLPKMADIGPFAGVSLALPAFLLTIIVRSREHSYVQNILKAPRAVASITSFLLFVSAGALVLNLTRSQFKTYLLLAEIIQAILWVWMSVAAVRIIRRS